MVSFLLRETVHWELRELWSGRHVPTRTRSPVQSTLCSPPPLRREEPARVSDGLHRGRARGTETVTRVRGTVPGCVAEPGEGTPPPTPPVDGGMASPFSHGRITESHRRAKNPKRPGSA
ncbi:unnamed protein product [Boreogadus saida]